MQDLNQLQAYLRQFAKYPAEKVKGSSKKYNQYGSFNLSGFNSPPLQRIVDWNGSVSLGS